MIRSCRILFCLIAIDCAQVGARADSGCTDYRRDFDALWSAIRDRYAYLQDSGVDWKRVRAFYAPAADTVSSRRTLVELLERVIDELHDPHAGLRVNTQHSWRLVPSGLDLWAEWRGDSAIVTEVRPQFAADQAGIRAGMRIIAVNGVAVREAARARFDAASQPPDSSSWRWALLSILAGRHDAPRTLRVQMPNGAPRDIALDLPQQLRVDAPPALPRVEHRLLANNIGYIRLNDLGDFASVAEFDSALSAVAHTRALILDLRNTPGGGNTSVAEPILGRLISRRQSYQRVVPRGKPANNRGVDPRGPWTYTAPLAVLVDHWTGSMGEGMAIGLDALKRGIVVGTRMAGLAGAVDEITLPCSGIRAGFATARLLHLNGTPREQFIPPVLVDMTSTNAAADPILERAVHIVLE